MRQCTIPTWKISLFAELGLFASSQISAFLQISLFLQIYLYYLSTNNRQPSELSTSRTASTVRAPSTPAPPFFNDSTGLSMISLSLSSSSWGCLCHHGCNYYSNIPTPPDTRPTYRVDLGESRVDLLRHCSCDYRAATPLQQPPPTRTLGTTRRSISTGSLIATLCTSGRSRVCSRGEGDTTINWGSQSKSVDGARGITINRVRFVTKKHETTYLSNGPRINSNSQLLVRRMDATLDCWT